jgi:hypothetical protein
MNPDSTKSPIKQEEVTASKKTLGIHDSPAGGNKGHLSYIKDKATHWVTRMTNGHLPSHIAWVAYKHQLWPRLCYGLGTMTNDLETTKRLLYSVDHKTLNVLGVMRNVTRGLWKLHSTFGGFGLFDLPTEQLISKVNMLFHHYHASTNLSKKLDASLAHLQLQLGTPYNPFTLDYNKWGYLAPLSWTKILWKLLNKFDIMLYMTYSPIPFPRERDQVIMEIIFSHDLTFNVVKTSIDAEELSRRSFCLTSQQRMVEILSTSPSIQEKKQASLITNFLWSNQQEKTGAVG